MTGSRPDRGVVNSVFGSELPQASSDERDPEVLVAAPQLGAVPLLLIDGRLVGARDLDPWEIRDLASSAISQLSDEDIRARGVQASFEPFLIGLSSRVDGVYLHIDLDVLDPSEAPVNHAARCSWRAGVCAAQN